MVMTDGLEDVYTPYFVVLEYLAIEYQRWNSANITVRD